MPESATKLLVSPAGSIFGKHDVPLAVHGQPGSQDVEDRAVKRGREFVQIPVDPRVIRVVVPDDSPQRRKEIEGGLGVRLYMIVTMARVDEDEVHAPAIGREVERGGVAMELGD